MRNNYTIKVKYTMMTPIRLLIASTILMWIHQVNPCLVLYPVEKIVKFEEMKKLIRKQEESIKQRNDERIKEINKKKELYLEERDLLQQEPEYFTEKVTEFADFVNVLSEDYSNNGNITELYEVKNPNDEMDEEYPNFPAIENDEEYDYSEFENITAQNPDDDSDDEHAYDGEEYEEFYGEYFPNEKRDKRDATEVINGLVDSGEKLLSGNMVGSITTFLKTLAKPIFHYFVKSDNDNAMTKFTHRMLPETNLKHSPDALMISRNAREGHGEKVWEALASNSRKWNPRSNYKKDKFHQSEIHLECRKNIPIIDKNIVSRLKSVSLMMTSLMTSLHDTTILDLNHGFKEASRNFKNITESTKRILEATVNNPDTEAILIMLKNIAMTMDAVTGILTSNTTEIIRLAIGGSVILLIILLAGIIVKLIQGVKADIKNLREEVKEIKELVKPEAPSVTPEQEIRVTVSSAVTDAMQTSFGQLLSQLQVKPSIPAFQQAGSGARIPVFQQAGSGVGIPTGMQYHGALAVRPHSTGSPATY